MPLSVGCSAYHHRTNIECQRELSRKQTGGTAVPISFTQRQGLCRPRRRLGRLGLHCRCHCKHVTNSNDKKESAPVAVSLRRHTQPTVLPTTGLSASDSYNVTAACCPTSPQATPPPSPKHGEVGGAQPQLRGAGTQQRKKGGAPQDEGCGHSADAFRSMPNQL